VIAASRTDDVTIVSRSLIEMQRKKAKPEIVVAVWEEKTDSKDFFNFLQIVSQPN
jgi:hypothetical protein